MRPWGVKAASDSARCAWSFSPLFVTDGVWRVVVTRIVGVVHCTLQRTELFGYATCAAISTVSKC